MIITTPTSIKSKGIIYILESIQAIAISTEQSIDTVVASGNDRLTKAHPHNSPFINSTAGYCMEMRFLQFAHLPN